MPDTTEPPGGDEAQVGALFDARDLSGTSALIGLGGNTGPVAETFDWAFSEIATRLGELVAVSRVYRTEAIGPAAGQFLNAAVEIVTDLDPRALLDQLHGFEDLVGRTRSARWAARRLDLDLLAYGDEVRDGPDLRLPHPGCLYRRFVLDPLAEIAPDRRHPGCGDTFATIRDALLTRPLPVAAAGDDPRVEEILDRLASERPETLVRVTDDAALLLKPAKAEPSPRAVDLGLIPGTVGAAVVAVINAATDEPRPL